MRPFPTITVPLVLAASVLALTGCMPIVAGPTVSEDRDIDAVSKVVLDTSGDITITEGEPSLVIHAPQQALDRLTSDVDGETLVLGSKPGLELMFGDVRYDLILPDLEEIEVNGSGDIDASVGSEGTVRLDIEGSGNVDWTDLAADRVEIRLSGSGDIELAGTTNELAIELDGSGNIDSRDLDAKDATVSIEGSGDIDVAASDTLDARISGSGRITYSGDPTVNADVSGSGDVVHD